MLGADENPDARVLEAARRLFSLFGDALDLDLAVRLWDGSRVPLGSDVVSGYEIVVSSPHVLSSLVRRPTRDNLLLHYANGDLAIEGGDPIGFVVAANSERGFKKLRQVPKAAVLWVAMRVAVTRPHHARAHWAVQSKRNHKGFIRFHYDIGNEFYALFLGQEMQYSCAYFRDPENDLDQAQHDKLEIICQNLRLESGERFLDVGCGWGGLLCHAAERYGVRAHGVTLSQQQFEYAEERIRQKGLKGQVTVEHGEYKDLVGTYDKIASIEMIEHVGLDNYPAYLRKLWSLLKDGGLLLNQGTTRRAKRRERRSSRLRAGSRMMERYVFPGFELDNVGHTVTAMEAMHFEILQVEGWRDHYAQTTKRWCRTLWERRDEAESLVGAEKTRLWLAYLTGVSVAFQDGSLRVYQIVAAKRGSKGVAHA